MQKKRAQPAVQSPACPGTALPSWLTGWKASSLLQLPLGKHSTVYKGSSFASRSESDLTSSLERRQLVQSHTLVTQQAETGSTSSASQSPVYHSGPPVRPLVGWFLQGMRNPPAPLPSPGVAATPWSQCSVKTALGNVTLIRQ